MSAATPLRAENPPAVRTSPFVGLNPYTPEDNNFFFGREKETELITANLIASRLTLLYGPSGVGKSSVLQAGVIHGLQVRAREEIASGERPSYLVFYFNNWRVDPVPALLKVVAETIHSFLTVELPPPTTLTETLAAWTELTGTEFLIILDQFEEYFLYQNKIDPQDSIGRELPHVLKQEDLRVNIMLSFREDSLSQLDKFKGSIPNLFKNILRIKHLNLEAGRHVIQEPIYEYNRLRAADTPEIGIESELVEQVLNEVRVGGVVLGETGRGVIAQENAESKIEAPYLQLVMTRLWERERQLGSSLLRFATFQELGGAEQIVRDHLQKAMSTLTEPQQRIAASVFDRLVTPSGTKIAQTARDLAKNARVPEAELDVVLEQLASGQNRILRPVAPAPDRPDAPRYEIFHDVLSGAILEWRAKYEKDSEQKQLQAESERQRAQEDRETALKNEKLRARRIQFALWGTLAFLLVTAALAVFAFQQRNEAQLARETAEAKAAVAQTLAANAQGVANGILTALPTGNVVAAQTQVAAAQTQAADSQNAVHVLATALAAQSAGNAQTSEALSATLQAAQNAAATAGALRSTVEAAATSAGTQVAVRSTAEAASTSVSQFLPTPAPTLPGFREINWDKRLDELGIYVVANAKNVWSLKSATYQSPEESSGNVNIVVTVLAADQKPIPGIKVVQAFPLGSPKTDFASAVTDANGQALFPMSGDSSFEPLNTGKSFEPGQNRTGPYFVYVESPDQSDSVNGMGLPLRRHVQYLLTFQAQTPGQTNQTAGNQNVTETAVVPTPSLIPTPTTQSGDSQSLTFPTNTKLIFVSNRDGAESYYLYEMDMGTRGVRRISQDLNARQNFEPDYSSAAGRIAFMRKQTIRAGEEWNIFTSDLNGGLTQITRSQFNNWHPAWSFDGRQLVYTTSRHGDKGELYLDGPFQQRLTDNPATDIWPAWAPDNKRIVFASNRGDPNGDDFDLYTLDAVQADGTFVSNSELTVKPLTSGTGADLHPRWSSDGKKIVYRHVENDTNGDGRVNEQDLGGIWVVNADGTNPHNLTPRDSLENYPTWSPDGGWIAFSRWINGTPQLFAMTANGEKVTQLTTEGESNFEPTWFR